MRPGARLISRMMQRKLIPERIRRMQASDALSALAEVKQHAQIPSGLMLREARSK